ncbi:MAG: HAD hydrolase family protein [Clostridiales bacterium]
MKKVAFFDIDGTLLDCMNGIDRITNRVKKSIKEFQKCGNYAFIASGRPYAFIVDEILNFGFDGYLLVNGANVLINDELIYSKPMNKDDIKKFIADFERLNIQYILQGKKY